MLFNDWQLEMSVDDVLRGQGAVPAQIRARRPALVETAEWALGEGLPLLEPRVLAEEFEVLGLRHERLQLSGGNSLTASLLAQHLAGASRLVVMVCTVGQALEEVVSELLTSDPVLGLALDGVGTAAVEKLAGQACAHFEAAVPSGLYASIPLSPGMIGWPVDPGQRQVFDLLGQERLLAETGVRLNSSAMMSPTKSLTQVLGFGKSKSYQGRSCDYCAMKETCRYQDHYGG